MEKTLLELSFRAILIHLLNQIFYLKKNQPDFCLCEYWFYRRFKSFSEMKLNEKFLYKSKGYCNNCEIIEKLGELDFLSKLYKLFISGKVEHFSKIGENVSLIQETIEQIISYNFENDNLFKENVHLIDLVFDFNEEMFRDFSIGVGLHAEEYILHLKTIRERNDDETKKFSDTFYFSNFWFGLLFWKKEYPKFDMVVNSIIKNDYKKNCLKEIYFI